MVLAPLSIIYYIYIVAVWILMCDSNIWRTTYAVELFLWQSSAVFLGKLLVRCTNKLEVLRCAKSRCLVGHEIICFCPRGSKYIYLEVQRRVWRYQREVIRIRKLKDRQHNDQKKKGAKGQTTIYKTLHINLKIE
jgi:hypothetical protein